MISLRNLKVGIPLVTFIMVIFVLWRGLGLHPNQIPSPFIGKSAPQFSVPNLYDTTKSISNSNLLGHVTFFNIWATWCDACADEHETLVALAKNYHVTFVGLNYKDKDSDAKKYLQQHGNPYQFVGTDHDGSTAINWGVYGAPETFIIDKHGIIRYKQIGPITAETWQSTLQPLVMKLESES